MQLWQLFAIFKQLLNKQKKYYAINIVDSCLRVIISHKIVAILTNISFGLFGSPPRQTAQICLESITRIIVTKLHQKRFNHQCLVSSHSIVLIFHIFNDLAQQSARTSKQHRISIQSKLIVHQIIANSPSKICHSQSLQLHTHNAIKLLSLQTNARKRKLKKNLFFSEKEYSQIIITHWKKFQLTFSFQIIEQSNQLWSLIGAPIQYIMRGKVSQIYRLSQASIDLMTNYKPTIPFETQCQTHKVLSTLNSLKFAQLRLTQNQPLVGIGIRNILLYKSLRLTIYHLPKGVVMKLHDHPKMQVVNYVLKGKMEAKLFSPLSQGIYTKETHILEEKSTKFIDGMRNAKDNLHQFTAIEPTFFLDIIFPDYDQARPCTHYQEDTPSTDQNQIKLNKIEDFYTDFYQM